MTEQLPEMPMYVLIVILTVRFTAELLVKLFPRALAGIASSNGTEKLVAELRTHEGRTETLAQMILEAIQQQNIRMSDQSDDLKNLVQTLNTQVEVLRVIVDRRG